MSTPTLEQRGKAILAHIASVREKRKEQDALLADLLMQAEVMMQGIDPEQVKSYGYDPARDGRKRGFNDPHGKRLRAIYNFVTMNDGTRVELDPPVDVPG